MARKSWDQLSENYRNRLIRNGITPQSHAEGADLRKARSHNERERLQDWIADFSRLYRRDADDIQEVIDDFGWRRVYKAVRLQDKMQDAYHNGHFDKAKQLWRTRDTGLPDWMHFYHGYFA